MALQLLKIAYLNRGGGYPNHNFTFSPLPACPEPPLPSSHFPISQPFPAFQPCRRLRALGYPAPPALHPSHCIIRAEPPQSACLSSAQAFTTRALGLSCHCRSPGSFWYPAPVLGILLSPDLSVQGPFQFQSLSPGSVRVFREVQQPFKEI